MNNTHQPNSTGNDRYVGYMADVLHELARTVGFRYRLQLSVDGGYGLPRHDGSWNGMIGEVLTEVSSTTLLVSFFLMDWFSLKG